MKQDFTVRHGALDGVEAFLSVAHRRNFRRAAAELGVTPSAMSQAVRALEARLGAALFTRTTRSVGLTEAGERFLSRAKPAFEEIVAASEVARGLGQRPSGLLRLSVPGAVVPLILEPVIASFCRSYPEVEVEIAASAELVDLAAEGFDAGIRLGQFIAADMVAVRLTPPFPYVVVGSPDYLGSAEAAGAHRRSAWPRLPAHAPLGRDDRALALCRREQDGRGDRLRAAHRARLLHARRSGGPRSRACAGARPARQSADCRGPVASAAYGRSPSQRPAFFYTTRTDGRCCPSCARSSITSGRRSAEASVEKKLKTAMGRPCSELAWFWRRRHIRLAPAPPLLGVTPARRGACPSRPHRSTRRRSWRGRSFRRGRRGSAPGSRRPASTPARPPRRS